MEKESWVEKLRNQEIETSYATINFVWKTDANVKVKPKSWGHVIAAIYRTRTHSSDDKPVTRHSCNKHT
jgi:hypothetical protein